MRVIDKNNFPEFVVDYLDGNLSEKETQTLFSFLQINPECQAEFDMLTSGDSVRIKKENTFFTSKSRLHKQVNAFGNINESNYLEMAIASMEGDLTVNEDKDFSSFRKENSVLEKEISLVQKIKLSPEEIRFEKKELLYKKTLVVSLYPILRWTAAAAVILSAWFIVSNENKTYEPRQSQNQIAAIDSVSSFEWVIPFKEKKIVSSQMQPKKKHYAPIENKATELITSTEIAKENSAIELIKTEESNIIADELTLKNETIETPEFAFNTISAVKNTASSKEKTNSLLHPMEWIRMGTKLVNRVSKREIKLFEHFDNSGDLVAYTIVSGENKIHRTVKN